jgi:vitamin B12 transporter
VIRSRSVDIPRSFVSMVVLALALSLAARPAAAAPQTRATIASGIVTDASGAPLARVRVRAVDATGIERGVALTDDAGRFLIAGGGCSGCRVEASPPGFLPNAVAVAGSAPLRLALALAPVRETVVVTPTRDDAPSSQVGSAMTVFDRDDIVRAGEPPLSDLLATVPGAAVVANGAPGSVTSLFVRGGESSYNRVLLDGIPLNEPGGTFDFGNLTTVGIERVEIVRGAESALFGSDAMASVVQLFSRRGQVGRPPSGTFAAEGGTYRTGRVTAAVSGGAGAWDYALSTARFQTNNRVPNDAFDNTTVSADVGGPIGPTMRLRVVGRFEGGRTGVPGQAGFGRPDLDASFDRRNGTIGATVESSGPGRWRQQASIALSRSLQVSRNLVEDPPYIPSFDGRTAPFDFYDFLYDSRNDIRRYHASYQSDWRFDAPSGRAAHILTAAVDWDGERATLDDRLAGTSLAARRDNVGWTVQHQYVGPRLSTTAGLRVEHNASFGTAAVPRVSAAWTLRRGGIAVGQTTLHGSAGLGIK